jgi:hypothetical protein
VRAGGFPATGNELTSTVLKRAASFDASTLFLGIAGAAAAFDIDGDKIFVRLQRV